MAHINTSESYKRNNSEVHLCQIMNNGLVHTIQEWMHLVSHSKLLKCTPGCLHTRMMMHPKKLRSCIMDLSERLQYNPKHTSFPYLHSVYVLDFQNICQYFRHWVRVSTTR